MRRFQYSVTAYDVQWKNIQETASLTPMELGGAVNVGDGYSRGIEAELNAQLTEKLNVHLGYTYDLTKLTSISELALENLTSTPERAQPCRELPKIMPPCPSNMDTSASPEESCAFWWTATTKGPS